MYVYGLKQVGSILERALIIIVNVNCDYYEL